MANTFSEIIIIGVVGFGLGSSCVFAEKNGRKTLLLKKTEQIGHKFINSYDYGRGWGIAPAFGFTANRFLKIILQPC